MTSLAYYEEGNMSSAALVEPAVESLNTITESPKPALSLAEEIPAQAGTAAASKADPHPLVPVFIIGGLAFMGTIAFVGTILMCLALRHSGVMAP
jgi:hypothetical protein